MLGQHRLPARSGEAGKVADKFHGAKLEPAALGVGLGRIDQARTDEFDAGDKGLGGLQVFLGQGDAVLGLRETWDAT